MAGGIYDGGLRELLACVVTPSVQVLDPDDGWLARWPGKVERWPPSSVAWAGSRCR